MSRLCQAILDFTSAIISEVSQQVKNGNLSSLAGVEIRRFEFSEQEQIRTIALDVQSTNIVLKPSASKSTIVRFLARDESVDVGSQVTVKANAGVLAISQLGKICTNFTVEVNVPDDVAIKAVSRSGNQVVKDLNTNELNIQTDSGNIVCKNVVAGSVTIHSRSGNIVAKALVSRSDMTVESENGNVVNKKA